MPKALLILCAIVLVGAWPVFASEERSRGPEYTTEVMESAAPPQGMRGRPINLPDISVIGVIDGHLSDDRRDASRNRLGFGEVEAAFQGFIHPEMRADVFLAIHRHGSHYEAEICEAKVSFLRVFEGLSVEVGKIHVNFGKLNKVHTHHRLMIDAPPLLAGFLGDHGLVGQGAVASYLLPLPFYLQADAGAWQVAGHEHEASSKGSVVDVSGMEVEVPVFDECDEFSLADKVYTGRVRTSFALTDRSELEIGTSGAVGRGAHFVEHLDKARVIGADLTFRIWPSAYGRWIFQNEYMRLVREMPVGRLERDGMYSFLRCRLSKYWEVSGRVDYVEGASPHRSIERAASGIVGYHFTETTRLLAQYKCRRPDDRIVNEAWLQLAFGIGPHSHELE